MDIKELEGKILTEVVCEYNEIFFLTNEGDRYKMYHNQDCCECVTLEDIDGDLSDLIGYKIPSRIGN